VKFIIRSAIAGLLSMPVALLPTSGLAQPPDESVLSVLEELRKGQVEMRKELAEIRKLVTPSPAPSAVEKLKAPAQIGSVPARGNQGARLTIIEFSDYQCPYCKRHVDQTMPRLLEDYVNKGTVRYAFRDYPLSEIHPLAAKAAEAARCAADQGKYWEMHDRLFANQKELQPEKLPGHAQAIGLDAGKFQSCLDDSRHAAAVQKDLEAGAQLGAQGTPAFVLGVSDGNQVKDGVIIHGAQPIAVFKAEIDKLLIPPPAASN
jgi:protein-disulfide isomerase